MAMRQPPDRVQATIAPYAGRTSLFLFGGLALLVANLVLSKQGWGIVEAILPNAPAASASSSVGLNNLSVLDLVGQVLIFGALLLVGSVSDEAGTFALVFLAALWLGFVYSHRTLLTGLFGLFGGTTPASSASNTNNTSNTNTSTPGSSPSAWIQ